VGLSGALKDDDRRVRLSAVTALGQIGPGAVNAVPALVQTLDDSSGQVRAAAVALGKVGKAALPELVAALDAQQERVRLGAALALGHAGPDAEEAIPKLIGSLNDSSPEVRAAAAAALGKVGKEALPPLIKALNAKEDRVRLGAIEALGHLGPPARDAIPKLITFLDDGDVRTEAMHALGRIGKYIVRDRLRMCLECFIPSRCPSVPVARNTCRSESAGKQLGNFSTAPARSCSRRCE
jgi:HEAT repeat protein